MANSSAPLVAIITRNDVAAIGACLASIRQAGVDAEFVVWDNGSEDGTVEFVRKEIAEWASWSVVTEPAQPIAAVLNRLMALASDRDLVVVHGAVVIHTANWLASLRACAERHPSAGVIGCTNLLGDGRTLSAGRQIIRAFGMGNAHANIGWNDRTSPAPGQSRTVDSIGPAVGYYRHAALAAAGGFDSRFQTAGWLQDDISVAVRAKNFDVVCDLGVTATRHSVPPPADPAATSPSVAWEEKWGWSPEFPSLHGIRRRWGQTRICWQVGERLLAKELPNHPDVDVVLVTWNSLAKLKVTLQSLAETDYPAQRIRVYVLDNGSTDGTPAYLQSLKSPGAYRFAIHAELLPVNIGLPPAMNLLIAKGTAPLVARLDDDILLPKHWLTQFIEDLRRLPYAGVVGGKIVNFGTRIVQHVGEPWGHKLEGEDHGQYDYLAMSNHVRGCCNLYRRKAFEVAGLLDVRFNPSQFDDPDHHLALRSAGFDIVYDGRVTIEHHLGAGVDATRKGAANCRGNFEKLIGKWGDDAFKVLDHGLTRSGRLIEDHRPIHLRAAPKPATRVA